MGVPEQVRMQTEKVQQLYADLNQEPEATAPLPDQGEDTVEDAAPINADEQTSTPTTTEPVEGGQDEGTFEQRYRSLQGKYNAEVPTLNAQVKELSQRLEQTQQLLATMQTAPEPQQQAPTLEPQTLLSEAEREEYGDSIDIMRKVSQEVVAPYQTEINRLNGVIEQMQGHVMPRVEQLAQQQTQTAEQNFWSNLTSVVPNWQEINNNQDFQTWLLETDPLSGLTRQTYLEDAQAKWDVNRVAGFFTAWQNASGHTAQTTPSQSSSELEKQVTPGRSRTTPAPQGDNKKTYTQQDIAKFFDDVRSGKFRGREEERGAIERDIFAAQAEGRIVQS